ncbi:MAG: glycosyltransferase family 2 protein [Thermoguttaceae bacterium]
MADFSFVVPVYKIPRDMLRECVDSLTNQTYREVEIVLVDDGSPDDCGKICDELAGLDSRIKVVHQANGGLSAARNAGLLRCAAPWVTFVDADDWVELDFAESFFRRISAQEKKADFYIYNGFKSYASREIVGAPYYADGARFESYEERERLQSECFMGPTRSMEIPSFIGSAWAKVFNRAFLSGNGLTFPDVPFGENSIFFLYAVEKANAVEYAAEPVYHYRDVEDGMVNSYRPNADAEQKLFLEKIFEFAEVSGKSAEFKDRLYLRVFMSAQRCLIQKFYHEEYTGKGLSRFRDCENFLRQKPFADLFRHIRFLDLNRNSKIVYLLLRWKLYGLHMALRQIYRILLGRQSFKR